MSFLKFLLLEAFYIFLTLGLTPDSFDGNLSAFKQTYWVPYAINNEQGDKFNNISCFYIDFTIINNMTIQVTQSFNQHFLNQSSLEERYTSNCSLNSSTELSFECKIDSDSDYEPAYIILYDRNYSWAIWGYVESGLILFLSNNQTFTPPLDYYMTFLKNEGLDLSDSSEFVYEMSNTDCGYPNLYESSF